MRCPKAGKRVKFDPNPASLALYSKGYCLPKKGEGGSVTSIPLGGRRATCLPGPGGGLVYVKWDGGCTTGVSSVDISKGSAALSGARRKRKRR